MKKYKVYFRNGTHRVVELSEGDYNYLKTCSKQEFMEFSGILINLSAVNFIEETIKYQ